jgi:hypothetical protein
MKNEVSQAQKKGRNILISTEILRSANISFEELQQHLIALRLILGSKFGLVIPKNINSLPAIQRVISPSQRLQALKGCEGFNRHISAYAKEHLESSYFVTVVASYLLERVDSIVLDPPIAGRNKRSDILAVFKDQQVYLECKQIHTSKFDYSREHENIFSILRDYIDVPHQINIRYNKSLSDSDWRLLGEALKERANKVTGDGRIIHNENLEVQVIRREADWGKNWDGKLHIMMEIVEEDLFSNCRYPGHVYVRDGITLSLSGPKVDYTKVLRGKITKSRSQSPQACSYMLMIDGNNMLGDLTGNIRALSSAFQPETNTRFSAAVIVTHYPHLDTSEIDFNFYLVANPFARFPISREFERLFSVHSKR